MASVVKLLTAQAVLAQSDVHTARIVVSATDVATEGRAGGLIAGEKYSPHELLFPLLLTSSNDAGVALARQYPTLVTDMQQFVGRTDATATTIADTTGLSVENMTTAADLSRIAIALYTQIPHVFDITRLTQQLSVYDNGWRNNIPFKSLPGYQGGKQGFLYESRQTGVALFTVGDTPRTTIAIAILGSDAVAEDMARLQAAALDAYHCETF
jgi:D-alanyl-D-alanine carboxypeptidase